VVVCSAGERPTDSAQDPRLLCGVWIFCETREADYRWPRVGFDQSLRSRREGLARHAGPRSTTGRASVKRQSRKRSCPTSPGLNGWPGTFSRSRRRLRGASHQGDGPVQFSRPGAAVLRRTAAHSPTQPTWKIRPRPSLLGQATSGPASHVLRMRHTDGRRSPGAGFDLLV
jgi:hypothetical protein